MVIRQTCGRLSGCCVVADEMPQVDVHQRLTIGLLENECRRNYLDKLKILTDQEILQNQMTQLSDEVLNIEKRLGDFESKIQQVIDVATSGSSGKRSHRHSDSDRSSDDEVNPFFENDMIPIFSS